MDRIEFARGLQSTLTWNDDKLSSYVLLSFRNRMLSGFGCAVSVVEWHDRDIGQALRAIAEASNEACLSEALCVPHIASLIIDPNRLQTAFWRGFFLLKLAQALGIDVGTFTLKAESLLKARLSGTGECKKAFLFADDLPVPFMDRGGNSVGKICGIERNDLTRKIKLAWKLIAKSKAEALSFIDTNTAKLAFRSEKDYPNNFSSGSFRELPGFSLILNAQLSNVSYFNIADAILHEAIHSIIYRYEALGSQLLSTVPQETIRITSPWTGTQLPVDSFIQACFVWFGLFHFWHDMDDPDSRILLDRAFRGFEHKEYIARCELCRPLLAQDICSILKELPLNLFPMGKSVDYRVISTTPERRSRTIESSR